MSAFEFPPGPQNAASSPGPWAHPTAVEVLPSHPGDDAPQPSSRLRWLVIAAIAVLSLALVVGVAFAVRGLAGSGGPQPEDALPPGAIVFAKVDLDPSIEQKVDGVRFARKFPELRKKISADSDLRRVLFDAAREEAGWGSVDYGTDVEPWLGNRVGLAVYPPQDAADDRVPPAPDVVVALQVTDEDAARQGLDRLISAAAPQEGATPGADTQKVKYVISKGYALLTATESATMRTSGPAGGDALADAPQLQADLAELDDGIALGWVDLEALAQVGGGGVLGTSGVGRLETATAGASGRASYLVRFDGPAALEVSGRVTGSDIEVPETHELKRFTELPSDTVASVGLADGQQYVPQVFASFRKALDASGQGEALFDDGVRQFEEDLGINLPGDLAVLFGSNLVASLGPPPDDEGMWHVGARVTTDPRKAGAVVDKIEQAAAESGQGFPLARRQLADGIIVASTEEHADRLAKSGQLGQSEVFRRAVPEVDDANAAFFVDIAALARHFSGPEGVDENLEPLLAAGGTAVVEDGGNGTYKMRLIVR